MLSTVRGIESLRETIAEWRQAGQTIGLVPTMGALHSGHMALVEAAKAECDRVVVSIFVNPIQFSRQDDLDSYPRRKADDQAKLSDAEADLLFAPGAEVMYPEGFDTKVSVDGLADCLCGAARPGHMTGVSTVVSKLFLQVLPDRAYFGEKDYQQLVIIRRMARDLDFPIQVRGIETVREADGLALSSRNVNLSGRERTVAPKLFEALSCLASAIRSGGNAHPVLTEGRRQLLDAGFKEVDYLELRREGDLGALESVEAPCRLFAAVWIGNTRLIDNLKVL